MSDDEAVNPQSEDYDYGRDGGTCRGFELVGSIAEGRKDEVEEGTGAASSKGEQPKGPADGEGEQQEELPPPEEASQALSYIRTHHPKFWSRVVRHDAQSLTTEEAEKEMKEGVHTE